jgi:AraC-like DNA-binding protein
LRVGVTTVEGIEVIARRHDLEAWGAPQPRDWRRRLTTDCPLTQFRRVVSAPWHDLAVNSSPAETQHLRELALPCRVRDRIDREYAQPLDVEALARGAHMSAGHLGRRFRLAYGESPYSYLMTRRIERAMPLLRPGDRSVTEVCFAVGCSSLGTFSTRFTELVGVPPSTYRREAAGATAGMPQCIAKQVTRPIRNREAPIASRT